MWQYVQRTGKIFQNSKLITTHGYSGKGDCKNDPDAQDREDWGPLPVGFYTMLQPENREKQGPFFIPLQPDPRNVMFGRKGFGCHGDSIAEPGNASDGCLITLPMVRHSMWFNGDHRLQVVAEDADIPPLKTTA